MLMDEDDLTTVKIEIYLTWQQPNKMFVITNKNINV